MFRKRTGAVISANLLRVSMALWIAVGALLSGGCETLNPITLGIGLASYAATGKGLADHAIGTLTQRDCNILDGLLRSDRKICEPHGSSAAQTGFKGLFASRGANEPRLRLSDRRVQPTPALDVMNFGSLAQAPHLRLSDSIVESSVRPSDRIAFQAPERHSGILDL